MRRCTHLYIVYQAVELNVPRGGRFPSTFHLTFSRSLCIYLSHYSAPVASLTLQRNCFAVYLSCSDASPNSLPVFHLFIPLHSSFVHAKNGLELKWPYFSVPFFFWLFYFFSPVIKSHQKASSPDLYAHTYISPDRFFHSPAWQLQVHLAPISVVDITSGSLLDRPVNTPLATETDVNILSLSCPYSSLEEHGGGWREGKRVCSWVRRWKGEESKEWKKKEKRKIRGGACHPSLRAVWFTSLLDFRLTWITAP